MSITYQQAVSQLLRGDDLSWQAHHSHPSGQITLSQSRARRLLHFLLTQEPMAVSKAEETLFAGLIAAWENTGFDPKEEQPRETTSISGEKFRLAKIETEGFGGINLYNAPPFTLNLDRQSWCLEGQNGSGKTSLSSAILWCLTGQRISEHLGPINDEGRREPVFDKKGNTIGTWPPIASYPANVADLKKDTRVRVQLTFRNSSGEEAIAERVIVSNVDGSTKTEKDFVDTQLSSTPQLLEVGLLMPCRVAHINFGDKSQTLYEAVKALTGLDRLGGIGDCAAILTHKARPFLKYSKKHGIDQIESNYQRHLKKAEESSTRVNLNLNDIKDITTDIIVEKITEINSNVKILAEKHSKKLETLTPDAIEASTPEGRRRISNAVGVAKDIAKHATEKVEVFSFLKALYKAQDQEALKHIRDVLSSAEKELSTALDWHFLQQQDQKLRFKAIASVWYKEPSPPDTIASCPLCLADLQTEEQKELEKELQKLKEAGEKAERKLDDVCRSIREDLISALPEGLRLGVDTLIAVEPKSDIITGATKLFTTQPPFSDVLTGIAEIMEEEITEKAQALDSFTPANEYTPTASDPASAASVRKHLYAIARILELAEWWSDQRTTFSAFWKDVVGATSDEAPPNERTLLGQILIIEEALAASQPYDAVLASLDELFTLATQWQQIQKEQWKREGIAEALKPLKNLRAFVDAETARSIAALSDRMKAFTNRIHLKERLDFEKAGLQKKEVYITGSFTEGMEVNALPIANTSWLKALLWAFIFCLRERTIEIDGHNTFPLILLDDPQTTFDPRNKRKWAHELVQLANLEEENDQAAQLLLTTHERQFFTLITEVEKLKGQQGLIAPADEISGCLTVINGNVIEREYQSAKDKNDDSMARSYIRQVRIYLEKLLKHMLRAEGPHIAGYNLNSLRKELQRLNSSHIPPFNRKPFADLLSVISGGERPIVLINNPPHDDDETTGLAEAKEIHEFWKKPLQERLNKAFSAFSAFESHSGDPRVFNYPENTATLSDLHSKTIAKTPLFKTGLAAAAATDGRIGDGLLKLEEWEQAEQISLFNHDVYRLTANTLDPVATIGNMVIVSNYETNIAPKRLVVAAVEDRLLARRYQASDLHPDLAVLTAQAINPYELSSPVIAPRKDILIKKIVGTLFTANGASLSTNEIESIDDPNAYLPYLDNARLFKVEGRSAEPIALEGQFLLVGKSSGTPEKWGTFDGQLAIAVDEYGASYFKRIRSPRAGLYVLESLNPDGTTPAELLSVDGQQGIPRLTNILPVLGVLFEIPSPD